MENIIAQIKSKVDIVAFVERYVDLKKSGTTYKANCPFHKEHTPSFVVSASRQIWRCFGACAKGGDVIGFLMEIEKISFIEAVRHLANEFGVDTRDLGQNIDPQLKNKDRLIALNQHLASYYQKNLSSANGVQALEYLHQRGLSDKLIKHYQIGFAFDGFDATHKFLLSESYSVNEQIEAGIIGKSENGHLYDRMRNRIMFPICNTTGQVIAFGGRTLQKDDKVAKYINTPETVLYQKRASLYGIFQSAKAISEKDQVVVVEGEFDCLSLFGAGISNVVALKGTAFTDQQLKILGRYSKNIVMALDSDFAGNSAALKAILGALEEDFSIHVVEFSLAKDPDEAIQKYPQEYKNALKNSKPVFDFLIDYYFQQNAEAINTDVVIKSRTIDNILPYLTKISNPIVKNYYLEKLCQVFTLRRSDLESHLKTFLQKNSYRLAKIPEANTSTALKSRSLQSQLLGLLSGENINLQEDCTTIKTELANIEQLLHPSFLKIINFINTSKVQNSLDLEKILPKELEDFWHEGILLFQSQDLKIPPQKHLQVLLIELKKALIKEKITSLKTNSNNSTSLSELATWSAKLKTLENK